LKHLEFIVAMVAVVLLLGILSDNYQKQAQFNAVVILNDKNGPGGI
jgi:hypothetical protein